MNLGLAALTVYCWSKRQITAIGRQLGSCLWFGISVRFMIDLKAFRRKDCPLVLNMLLIAVT
jgi:hypothetical protein